LFTRLGVLFIVLLLVGLLGVRIRLLHHMGVDGLAMHGLLRVHGRVLVGVLLVGVLVD